MTALFAAWPVDCKEATYNTDVDRAECSQCNDGFGVKDDDKTCAGNCVKI